MSLVAVTDALRLLDEPAAPLVIDCSFELANPGAGLDIFRRGHLPGAQHAHLDTLLSGSKTGGNGRHPLPSKREFAHAMAVLGLHRGQRVLAYDNAGGMFAARLWWLLRWAGHTEVMVVDGGIADWQRAGGRVATGEATVPVKGDFEAGPDSMPTISYEALRADVVARRAHILDARAPERFRGEGETLDVVGGHIPGARNRFFRDNLAADGRFKPAAQLAAEFGALMEGRPAADIVAQCGSGVTACHNLLAMHIAGLPGARLYPGSWSEWCVQAGAPMAQGGTTEAIAGS